MDKRFGYFVFAGLLIGALFGLMWSAGRGVMPGPVIGALAGVAIGWFAAAAVIEKKEDK